MSKYSGQDLISARNGLIKELDKKISLLESAGIELANAEQDYRVFLSKKLLTLTDVRSGQVKNEIAKGDVHIAEKRLHRDISKIKYETIQQGIYGVKIKLKIIESDIINERVGR